MTINNYRKIKHDKLSQYLFCLLIASVFIFCVFIQRNEISISIEPVKAEEVSELPLQPANSVMDKINLIFGKDARIMTAIIRVESNFNPRQHSTTDLMKDGRAFSIGLAQINLTVHKIGGLNCPKAFKGHDYEARVINESLYQDCVNLAENEDVNLSVAKDIFDHNWFWSWGAYQNLSYKKYL